MPIQSIYQQTIKFAARKHLTQCVPSSELPYLVHLSNVATEILVAAPQSEGFDLAFAIQVALLHDTLEDTETTFEELSKTFGKAVAEAVLALTKNDALPKHARMTDSLQRIKALQKEVWAVKLADRITNLQTPPAHWDKEKIIAYKAEAKVIAKTLEGGNAYLEQRLHESIEEYIRA
jgi:guanosine-3',5'-bis(diphosphate) 3'-pyrophosphohydrolase